MRIQLDRSHSVGIVRFTKLADGLGTRVEWCVCGSARFVWVGWGHTGWVVRVGGGTRVGCVVWAHTGWGLCGRTRGGVGSVWRNTGWVRCVGFKSIGVV